MSDRGIHHITAVAGDPKQNYEFYTQIMGLRLVKETLNFDDPSVYHLYYGNESGYPGTILTGYQIIKQKRQLKSCLFNL